MADDRPVEDTTDQLARVTAELADFKSTVLARLSSRPTGDVEMTIRTTPKANTLILDGSTPLRSTYPALWQWAQDQGLVIAGLFTNGNGSTTFGLPDFRGRVVRGNAAGEAVGQLTGADSASLSSAHLPSHSHSAANAGGHSHGFTTDGVGDHGGHFPASGPTYAAPQAGALGLASWNNSGSGNGGHSHTGGTSGVSDHSHSIGSTGSGSSFDNRQASVNINWLIYT